ncbi:MAG: hypothetical protein PHD32_02800 [Eubacteriales bacterium]|nr:hypothetical protein [Eubacteriales bacterium]
MKKTFCALWIVALCLALCACAAKLPASAQITELQEDMSFYQNDVFTLQMFDDWTTQETADAPDKTPFVAFLAPDGSANINVLKNKAYFASATGVSEKTAKQIVEQVNQNSDSSLSFLSLEHKMLGNRAAAVITYGGQLKGTDTTICQQLVPVDGTLYCITYTMLDGFSPDLTPVWDSVVFR